MELQDNDLVLRKVAVTDESLLFDWANDPVVRQSSFNHSAIHFAEHQKWFRKKLSSKNTVMWVLECSGVPCGLVRIEKTERETTLNYLIAASHRGQGLAVTMLKMALEKACSELANENIFAYALPDNIASCKTLEKVGFRLEKESKEKKCFVYYCT